MRLGILGGTFDPPHRGHLVLAERCAAALELDRVLFVPSFRPPHKSAEDLSPFDTRVEMVKLAIAAHSTFAVSTLERDRGGVSFTIQTLAELRQREGAACELWLLLGQDSLADFATWRDPRRISELAQLAVYCRPGAMDDVPAWLAGKVRTVEGPLVDVSSTALRARLARGADVGDDLPAAVLAYIQRRGLYREPGLNGGGEGRV